MIKGPGVGFRYAVSGDRLLGIDNYEKDWADRKKV